MEGERFALNVLAVQYVRGEKLDSTSQKASPGTGMQTARRAQKTPNIVVHISRTRNKRLPSFIPLYAPVKIIPMSASDTFSGHLLTDQPRRISYAEAADEDAKNGQHQRHVGPENQIKESPGRHGFQHPDHDTDRSSQNCANARVDDIQADD